MVPLLQDKATTRLRALHRDITDHPLLLPKADITVHHRLKDSLQAQEVRGIRLPLHTPLTRASNSLLRQDPTAILLPSNPQCTMRLPRSPHPDTPPAKSLRATIASKPTCSARQ